ncbi:MAG: sigma-70 family RNA polymerase sigma factor [Bacteroidales bacterium]|nr:sigma-70 family RNA polymerase sigma factor [Bacteroidales bacterium]
MSKISDAEILKLFEIKNKRQRAFTLLVNKYKEQAYWLIRRIVIDHEDTNDVIQNTFIKVWKNLENFQGNSKLYTWIYRIATNEAITYIKSNKSRYFVSLDEMINDFSDKLEADVYFKSSDIQIKLQKAIASLPNKQKLIFIMRYYENMSYKDIADAIDVKIGTIKSAYHIAAKKIEKYLISE